MADEPKKSDTNSDNMTGSPEDRGEASGGNMGYGGAGELREEAETEGKDEGQAG